MPVMFTAVESTLGGILLHISTSSLLRDCGRVFGVSGLIEGAVFGDKLYWRWSALTGLILGPIINRATGLSRLMPDPSLELWSTQPLGRLVTAGILVGMGSRVRRAEKMMLTLTQRLLTHSLRSGRSWDRAVPGEFTLILMVSANIPRLIRRSDILADTCCAGSREALHGQSPPPQHSLARRW
jgi:hypothetical protein